MFHAKGDMIVMRLALVTLLFLPALAYGQTKPEDEDKVSNDNPARPLQMPPASTGSEGRPSMISERFSRMQGVGTSRSRAIYTILEDQRFDSSTAIMASSFRSRRKLPAALDRTAASRAWAAYRLFGDAGARKPLDEAEGPAELKNLEPSLPRVFHHGRRRTTLPIVWAICITSSRALRLRRRLLAGHLAASTPRHRFVAWFAIGEGRRRAFFEQARAAGTRANQRPSWPTGITTRRSPLGRSDCAPHEIALLRLLTDEQAGRRTPCIDPSSSASSPAGLPSGGNGRIPHGNAASPNRSFKRHGAPIEFTQWESNSLKWLPADRRS